MKHLCLRVCVLLIAAEVSALPLKALSAQAPTEIIVQFRPEVSSSEAKQATQDYGHAFVKELPDFVLVKPRPGEPLESALQKYRQNPSVMQAQPNFRYQMFSVPNDPKYKQYWGLKNVGQTVGGVDAPGRIDPTGNPGKSGLDTGAEQAWENITDCSATVVAVVDTGINYTHEDLAANLWKGGAAYPKHGYNFVDNNNDPLDRNGHGTHVAGTIGALGNNGLGGSGLCWKANIMAVAVLNAQGSGSTASVASGIKFAADQGAKVINLSLGGPSRDPLLHDAIKYAGQKGVLVIAAAGNDGVNLAFDDGSGKAAPAGMAYTYPCSWTEPNLVCVGALDQSYGLARFSNYGSTQVHIGAPGVNIVSSINGSHTIDNDPLNGTNWTLAASVGTTLWGFTTQTFNLNGVATLLPLLSSPAGYNTRNTIPYSLNGVMTASRTMDLTGDEVTMSWFDFSRLPDTNARLRVLANKSGMAPTALLSENTNQTFSYQDLNLTPFISNASTVTFEYTAPATAALTSGSAVLLLSFDKLKINQTSYSVLAGTSMACPHAVGVSAMLFSFNPQFSFADVADALIKGGVTIPALDKKSTSGNSLSAIGSLSYIKAPKGGKASKELTRNR